MDLFACAGLAFDEARLTGYRSFYEPATYTDPEAEPLLKGLRDRGVKVGVLSNTVWPRAGHEEIFARCDSKIYCR